MKFNVTEVEFDFDDDYANGFELTFDEEIELRDLTLGVWEADDEDDLLEEITAAAGWCVRNIEDLCDYGFNMLQQPFEPELFDEVVIDVIRKLTKDLDK